VALEIRITPIVTVVKGNGYQCKIERGDILQNGVLYKDQVRRLTLTKPDGSVVVHETKGSSCDVHGRKWLSDETNGSIATY
jgi:RecB family endonuclease NucS